MKGIKILHKSIPADEGGAYNLSFTEDFEYEKPSGYFYQLHAALEINLIRSLLRSKSLPVQEADIISFAIKKGIEKANQKVQALRERPILDQLDKLLNARSKKEQISLLKGLIVSSEDLMSFYLHAENVGFTLSAYTSEIPQSGLDLDKMPDLVEIHKGEVTCVGQTELSEGQLRQAVEHRKHFHAKILDKEDEWHCIFGSFNSLGGKENWKDGAPHFHYISSKFGIERSEVVKQLKTGKYSLGNLPHLEAK